MLDKAEHEDENSIDKKLPFKTALKTVLGLAYMPIIAFMCHPIYSLVNAAVLGRDSSEQLGGFGLGSLTLGICVISISYSFTCGSSTLISQAYGQKDYELCAVYRNRQILLSAIQYCIVAIPMLFVEKIYIAIGQDPAIAAYATQYVHITLPALFFYG